MIDKIRVEKGIYYSQNQHIRKLKINEISWLERERIVERKREREREREREKEEILEKIADDNRGMM